jgi:ankyrin repeat protein
VARARPLVGAVLALCLSAGCGDERPGRDLDRELLAAAYGNDVATARELIAAGADVNVKDRSEQSAYLIATSEVGDDPRLLELTLGAGADVDAKDSFDGTGLIRAAERGNSAIVERLLAAGIDVDHVNRLGWTALLEAVILGDGGGAHVRTVRLIVDAGADVAVRDKDGLTALQHARRRGFTRIERILSAARR